jgi:hypothetical protein
MLFICDLFNDAVSSSDYIASNDRMTGTGCGETRSWPILRYYSGICRTGLRKIAETSG